MNKEYLEALERIKKSHYTAVAVMGCERDYETEKAIEIVETALQRLESIDNPKPSEALKLAELLECDLQATNDLVTRTINGYDYLDILETIKQALINAQEKEKEKLLFKNIHNTKVKTPLVSIFNGLSKEERYKFTEHIYYNWEEMKEELEDMNKELEKENELLKERIQFLEKEYNNLMEDKDNLESELFKHKESKKYLKWEDLEFDDEWKYQEVKLNGTKYIIKYKCGFDFFDNYYEVIKIYNQNERKQLFKLYNNDKFFNDLHLEKVTVMYLTWKDLDFKDEKQCKFVKASKHKWRIEYKYVYLDDGNKSEVVWLIYDENNCIFCKFYDAISNQFDNWKFEVID